MWIYVVEYGDSVDSIAQKTGIPVETIIYDNQLVSPYGLAVGQALLMPREDQEAGQEESQEEGREESLEAGQEEGQEANREDERIKREVMVNGYAYPYISPWVLTQTLPYLTELSVFSYGFTAEGELVPPVMDDSWMTAMAVSYGVLPVLTLTPFGTDGKFNNNLISAVVWNMEAQQRLFDELAQVMREKDYGGLDIDFEYILASDRDAFTAFVRNAVEYFHAMGVQVGVALAPKVSANQEGLLYEGKDYPALGAAADQVLLMTYEWGYKYGPNMAVAPLNMVRRVVEYAVTEIPPEKINLGIPNYGYDWPLPFERGVTAARTIGNVEAVQIAVRQGAAIQFDEVAQSPFFRYWEEGIEHEVWFEDVRSLRAKFGLIQEFGLRGAGYWQIMRWFRANWLLLEDTFRIIKSGDAQ